MHTDTYHTRPALNLLSMTSFVGCCVEYRRILLQKQHHVEKIYFFYLHFISVFVLFLLISAFTVISMHDPYTLFVQIVHSCCTYQKLIYIYSLLKLSKLIYPFFCFSKQVTPSFSQSKAINLPFV